MSYDNQGEEDGGAVLIWGAFLLFILMFALALCAGWTFMEIRDAWNDPEAGEGSFQEQGAGQYEYQVIMTMRGVEVYQKCNKM